MAKVMNFIDGSWLYKNLPRLAEEYGEPGYRIDFGKLPGVLGARLQAEIGGGEIDIVRTYLFASYPDNYDPVDGEAAERQLDFLHRLKEEFHYEVVLFPIDFAGRRLSIRDRDPNDTFQPKEKCVDISLATHMLYFAAIPYAYDIALAVIGDMDFKPVLQYVRRLGKRVAIASIKGSCSSDYSDPRDEARVRDFDIIWINDHLSALELKYEPHRLRCESPNHRGDPFVWTTYYPKKGERFYCDDCRAAYQAQRAEARREALGAERGAEEAEELVDGRQEEKMELGVTLEGVITKLVEDRGYGFLRSDDGKDYFFHLSDLSDDLRFDELELGDRLVFEIKQKPTPERGGAAQNVRWCCRLRGSA